MGDVPSAASTLARSTGARHRWRRPTTNASGRGSMCANMSRAPAPPTTLTHVNQNLQVQQKKVQAPPYGIARADVVAQAEAQAVAAGTGRGWRRQRTRDHLNRPEPQRAVFVASDHHGVGLTRNRHGRDARASQRVAAASGPHLSAQAVMTLWQTYHRQARDNNKRRGHDSRTSTRVRASNWPLIVHTSRSAPAAVTRSPLTWSMATAATGPGCTSGRRRTNWPRLASQTMTCRSAPPAHAHAQSQP